MKKLQFSIRGITPLLMHSERLANPFDELTRQIKAISGKRKKTEDDLLEMARIEWRGGLYHDDDAGVHVPGYNIFAAIVGGGKVHKLGTAIKRSVLIEEDLVPLKFEGPADPDKLFADKRFVDMRSVKVGTAKILRCRPVFKEWALSFTALFEETVIQKSELQRCVECAGSMIGIGDYRPRFGRFEVVEVK